MNNCGEKFHNEIAKFRFLNELIKVLSPKVGGCGYAARSKWDMFISLWIQKLKVSLS